MKREFKPGDRVRLRGYGARFGEAHKVDGLKGEVKENEADKTLLVKPDGSNYSFWVYPSQCIRLVKKPRRTIWANEYKDRSIAWAYPTKESADESATSDRISCTEFVEVRRKK